MVALPTITACIYGDVGSDDFIHAKYLDILTNFTKDDWLHVLKKQYIDTVYTALIGKPSTTIEEENLRSEAQKACLGEQGLNLLKAKLKHATRINETQIPASIIEAFPIPSVSSISSIKVLAAVNPPSYPPFLNCIQEHINSDNKHDIPYSHSI